MSQRNYKQQTLLFTTLFDRINEPSEQWTDSDSIRNWSTNKLLWTQLAYLNTSEEKGVLQLTSDQVEMITEEQIAKITLTQFQYAQLGALFYLLGRGGGVYFVLVLLGVFYDLGFTCFLPCLLHGQILAFVRERGLMVW